MLRKIFMPNPFTGRHMAGYVVAFFAVIIGVNLTLAYNASRTWTGLVVKNSYVASQDFNRNQARADKQKALGWKADISFGQSVLKLQLSNRDGSPLNGAEVSGIIGQPTHEADDTKISFIAGGNGRYSTTIKLKPGPWVARLEIIQGDKTVNKVLSVNVEKK